MSPQLYIAMRNPRKPELKDELARDAGSATSYRRMHALIRNPSSWRWSR
jgi:hypothetical protein